MQDQHRIAALLRLLGETHHLEPISRRRTELRRMQHDPLLRQCPFHTNIPLHIYAAVLPNP